ncbi:branched-chain amino acid ABC transporter permease [Bradyrhizobium sp. dw_411]|uniref:branched-chain amino acid ABC transporter permease n=1 Tax=Bradyrhizobium sp. dw_411 TaxID=2720082 RepID=UPI001BCF0B4E
MQLLASGLSTGSIYALVGLGLMLAFKGTGVLNFAQGELVTLGAYTALFLSLTTSLPYWAIFILTILVAGVVGIVFERLLVRPLMRAPEFTVVVATLAVGLMIKDALRIAWQESVSSIPSPFADVSVRFGDISINAQYLWVTFCALAIMGMLALFFNNNLAGKAMRAVAQNQTAARLMGIRVNRVFSATFALSSAIAALAGILIAPIHGIEPEMGNVLMKGFVAAVLGGFNSLVGCVIAAFMLGVIETFGGAFFGGLFKDVTAFALLILVLLVRPNGLFGSAEARRV